MQVIDEYKLLNESLTSIKNKIPYMPDVAITLGSGLGDFVNDLKIDKQIDFDEIKHFPNSDKTNHKGRLMFTRINDVKVLVMNGRLHYYELYEAKEAVRPVRLAALMGVKTLIVTNASGGINKNFKPGTFMLIKDHISFYMPNPLVGPNIEEFGTRFPDMTEVYNKKLQEKIKKAAKKAKVNLKEGIYVQLRGPSFETPAEINLLAKQGADAVGMSTVIEVIAARHAGMNVGGISVITNLAAGLSKGIQTDAEVRVEAAKATSNMHKIITNLINKDIIKL